MSPLSSRTREKFPALFYLLFVAVLAAGASGDFGIGKHWLVLPLVIVLVMMASALVVNKGIQSRWWHK